MKRQRCTFSWEIVVLSLLFFRATWGMNHSVTKHIRDGLIRYHYVDESNCSSIIILGVGTAMSVFDYDKVSTKVAFGNSTPVVIIDHNPDNIIKTSAEKYANLVNAIKINISTLMPICSNVKTNIIVGGHSASGEASLKALQENLLDFKPVGYIGLDPYEISPRTFDEKDFILNIPALYWGFSKTTCLVTKEKAAEAAYEITSVDARVLFQIQNDKTDCEMTHCVFSDQGCGFYICGTEAKYEWIFDYLDNSIYLFLLAIKENIPFTKEYFQFTEHQRDIHIYVNQDEVRDYYSNFVSDEARAKKSTH